MAFLLCTIFILSLEWMEKARKVIVVVIFFVAAVITPPDIVSQIMVAIPMLLLYEFSIILCWILMKFRQKKEAEGIKEGAEA